MDFQVKNGVYNLDFKLSKLEKMLLDDFSNRLEEKGFQYLSIPTTISWNTFRKQSAVSMDKTLYIDEDKIHCLGGSAEQGILQYFQNKTVEPMKIYAQNQCFRKEEEYKGLIHLKEFKKIEQYCFTTAMDWEDDFEILINNSIEFLIDYGIKYRVRDVTIEDEGYHLKKYDIEIETRQYGWVETHSCSYFGEEQTKRFNINGATHTISNTGIATPRILIPFIENEKLFNNVIGGK